MRLDGAVVAGLTINLPVSGWLRLTPMKFAATPLGMGYGETRFASPSKSFRVLYIATMLVTGVAETIVRDRFVGRVRRRLARDEIEGWGMTQVAATAPLSLLDLRGTGLVQLGVTTNAVRGKGHRSGRSLSEALHAAAPLLDGILYPSRLTNELCVAVDDRAVFKLSASPVRQLTLHPGLIPALTALKIAII